MGSAQEALLLVLPNMVDRLVKEHPLTIFVLYVDDLGAHSRGEKEEIVAKCTDEMSRHAIEMLEGELGLTISHGRTGVPRDGDKTVC